MDIKIGNRLFKLRKEHGYSQEQLADELNVSRQAISKWERGVASPDTQNLIALAKLYNISLDELLGVVSSSNNNIEKEDIEINDVDNQKEFVHIGPGGIHVKDGKSDVDISWKGIHINDKGTKVNVDKDIIKVYRDKNKPIPIIESSVYGFLMIAATIAYILIGCYYPGGWEMGWLLYLLAIPLGSIVTAIKEHKFSVFAMPVLIAGIYVFVGMYFNIWHPTWLLFLAIPLYYIIVSPIDKIINKAK